MNRVTLSRLSSAMAFGFIATFNTTSLAEYIQVFGAPEYSVAAETGYVFQGGYSFPGVANELKLFHPGMAVNDSGAAVGSSELLSSGDSRGIRGLRWDASGNSGIEMAHLGTLHLETYVETFAINNDGVSVGSVRAVPRGLLADRAVRWDTSGAVTVLGNLGVDADGLSFSKAIAINEIGTAVGYSDRIIGPFHHARAVRWNAGGTSVTELGGLPGAEETFKSVALAVNDGNTTVGWAHLSNRKRATRWDGSGVVATQLGDLPIPSLETVAFDVNESGTSIGWANRGDAQGWRAIRWDAGCIEATELGNLGIDNSTEFTESYAYDINDVGSTVGSSIKFEAGVNLGKRAVRWEAFSTLATELGGIRFEDTNYFFSEAFSINNNGVAVGYVAPELPIGSDTRAVLWRPDGRAVDLNRFVDPTSGWKLTVANGISEKGWITGFGYFDPDGPGGNSPYLRLFTLHVPEPSALSLAILAIFMSLATRRNILEFAEN